MNTLSMVLDARPSSSGPTSFPHAKPPMLRRGVQNSKVGALHLLLDVGIYLLLPKGYSQEDHDAVKQMDVDTGHNTEDIDAIAHVPSSSNKGFDIGHEGGEYEVFEGLVDDVHWLTGLYTLFTFIPCCILTIIL